MQTIKLSDKDNEKLIDLLETLINGKLSTEHLWVKQTAKHLLPIIKERDNIIIESANNTLLKKCVNAESSDSANVFCKNKNVCEFCKT